VASSTGVANPSFSDKICGSEVPGRDLRQCFNGPENRDRQVWIVDVLLYTTDSSAMGVQRAEWRAGGLLWSLDARKTWSEGRGRGNAAVM